MASFEPILYETEEVGKRVKSSRVKHIWMLDISDSQFIIEYIDSRSSGKARVTLNEQEIFKGKKQGSEFTIPFHIGLQKAIVVVKGADVDLLIDNQYFKQVWARMQGELHVSEEELSISEEELPIPEEELPISEEELPISEKELPISVEEFESYYLSEQLQSMASQPVTDNRGLEMPKTVEKKPTELLIDTLSEPSKPQKKIAVVQEDLLLGYAENANLKAFRTEETSNTAESSDVLKGIFDPKHITAPSLVKKPGENQFEGTSTAFPSQFPSAQPSNVAKPQYISTNQPCVPSQPVPFMSPYMMPVQTYMTPQGMMYVSMPVPNPAIYMSPYAGVVPAVHSNMSTVQYQSSFPGFTPLIGPNPKPISSPQDMSFSSDKQLHSVANLGKNMHSPPLAQHYQDQIRSVQAPVVSMKRDLPRRS